MNNPLTSWHCDVCGNQIERAEDGYVIWKTRDDMKSHGFKIIHQTKCDLDDHHASADLQEFLGEKGLTYLLSHLSLGPVILRRGSKSRCDAADLDEFVDLIRRVQTPYYEEARGKFSNTEFRDAYSDANEVLPYLPDELKRIAGKY